MPAKKTTVRFQPRPTLPSLTARIEAARMTAIGFLRLAEKAEEGSPHRERLRSSAASWEAKAVELERLKRGRQTLTIIVPLPRDEVNF